MSESGMLDKLKLKYIKPLPDFKDFEVNTLGIGHLAFAFISYAGVLLAVLLILGLGRCWGQPSRLAF